MENLNAEQVKSDLEQFHHRILNTNLAEKVTQSEMMAIINALSLINSQEQRIKEITEENERLRAIPEQLHKEMSERMVEEVKTAKKYTVLIMQSEIKERCIKGGIYPAFVASTIDQIAKEMLEGE